MLGKEVLRHLTAFEYLLECCEERLMYLVPEGGEEGSGKPILPWAFLPIDSHDGILHLCGDEWGKEVLPHLGPNYKWGMLPHLLTASLGVDAGCSY